MQESFGFFLYVQMLKRRKGPAAESGLCYRLTNIADKPQKAK
ncbi:hypothetical protein [Porphyromonas gulae]|nr:hypothetical protein [Porphyromonas gulae]